MVGTDPRRHHRAQTRGADLRRFRAIFIQFWPLIRPNRSLLIVSVLLLVLATACETAAILLFGDITDHVLTSGRLSALPIPGLSWLGVAVIGAGATLGGEQLTAVAAERFELALLDQAFGHLQQLAPEFFDEHPNGDLVARLTGDLRQIEELVSSGLVSVISASVSVLAFAGTAFYLRWDLALISCSMAPVLWLAVAGFAGRIGAAAHRERRSDGQVTAVVQESLANLPLVQAYNKEAAERRRLATTGRIRMRSRLAESRLANGYEALIEVLETLCVLAVLGAGAWEISADRITLGGLMSFAAFIGYLYPPLQSLGRFGVTLASARASTDRIEEILHTPRAAAAAPAAAQIRKPRGELQFRDVTFHYPGRSAAVLSNLSLTARPGQVITITGASGSGKSTIARLLLRFYDPTGGAIYLDGINLQDLDRTNLRSVVTLVLQETLIIDGTIYDNIAFGSTETTTPDVIAAARAADAAAFIRTFPDGYRTTIGQHGRQLSGGQRQRLAIARAILRDTPIIVLDEPTTGLDDASAQRVMRPLRHLMTGRTTILITHDHRLIHDSDQVLNLSDPPIPPFQKPAEYQLPQPGVTA
jgi:ATP-binding cassette subfamily B protein